jgi:hypothetical protein
MFLPGDPGERATGIASSAVLATTCPIHRALDAGGRQTSHSAARASQPACYHWLAREAFPHRSLNLLDNF